MDIVVLIKFVPDLVEDLEIDSATGLLDRSFLSSPCQQPDSQQTESYPGLKTMEPFTLSKIGAKLVLIGLMLIMFNVMVLNNIYWGAPITCWC